MSQPELQQPGADHLLSRLQPGIAAAQRPWPRQRQPPISADFSCAANRLSVPLPRLGFMVDNRLSVRERELFLAEPHIAALSVSAGLDRGPVTVPMWYQYEPGGEAWILTEAASLKAHLIGAAGRFSLMVDRLTPTIRYVSVEGPVTRTIPETDELLWEIATRYLSDEKAREYVAMAKAEFGQQVVIYLRPERWLSSDLGPA